MFTLKVWYPFQRIVGTHMGQVMQLRLPCYLVLISVDSVHWNIVILMKFSSLAVLEVHKMTNSSAASDENFIKMMKFPFQCKTVAAPWCNPCIAYFTNKTLRVCIAFLFNWYQYSTVLEHRSTEEYNKDRSASENILVHLIISSPFSNASMN